MMTDAGSDSPPPVDIEAHAREAEAAYQRVRPLYEAFSEIVRSILGKALESKEVKVASIEARAKTVLSFAAKGGVLLETDPSQPKYREPLRDITDLAGVRVITFFPRTVRQVCAVVEDEFDVRERIDKTATLHKEDRFGYQSIHYIGGMKHTRTGLPEYGRFAGLVGEIQVRTILQHAWAEIEHDIQYKSVETIPAGLQRRSRDRLSRQVYGNRQGQLTRFELMVQVGMGETFFDRHHLNGEDF